MLYQNFRFKEMTDSLIWQELKGEKEEREYKPVEDDDFDELGSRKEQTIMLFGNPYAECDSDAPLLIEKYNTYIYAILNKRPSSYLIYKSNDDEDLET